jgi:site-specific recombinase XerD
MGTRPGIFAVDQGNGTPRQDTGIIESLDAVNRLIKRLGERAGLAIPVHCHKLRHGYGYALANAGHETRAIRAWMGHKNIQHTVRYTELAPDRFKNFWRD